MEHFGYHYLGSESKSWKGFPDPIVWKKDFFFPERGFPSRYTCMLSSGPNRGEKCESTATWTPCLIQRCPFDQTNQDSDFCKKKQERYKKKGHFLVAAFNWQLFIEAI